MYVLLILCFTLIRISKTFIFSTRCKQGRTRGLCLDWSRLYCSRSHASNWNLYNVCYTVLHPSTVLFQLEWQKNVFEAEFEYILRVCFIFTSVFNFKLQEDKRFSIDQPKFGYCGVTGRSKTEYGRNFTTPGLLETKLTNFNQILILQETANGRFAKVFEGRIGSNPLPIAIKIFPREDGESWLNEQVCFRHVTMDIIISKLYNLGGLFDECPQRQRVHL